MLLVYVGELREIGCVGRYFFFIHFRYTMPVGVISNDRDFLITIEEKKNMDLISHATASP